MENGGVFFVKKRTFPQRRVHYAQYQYFLFYILLISGGGGAYAPNAPPTYGPVLRTEFCLMTARIRAPTTMTVGRLELSLDEFDGRGGDALDAAAERRRDADLPVRRGVVRSAELVEHLAVDAEEQAAAHALRHERERHAAVQRLRLPSVPS